MARRSISEEIIDAGGMKINLYRATSPHAEKTALFLHGYKDAGPTFFPLIEHLDKNINAICFDFRGHGKSGRIECGASAHLLDHLKDLSFVTKHIGAIDVLIGHSMGANVALLFAAAMPECVSKLMIIDSLGPPGEDSSGITSRIKQVLASLHKKTSPKTFATKNECINHFRLRNKDLDARVLEHFSQYLIKKLPDSTYTFSHDHKLDGPTPFRFSNQAWQYILSSIAAKVVVVVPELGIIRQYEEYARRINDFRKAEILPLNNAGHHVHISNSQKIAQCVSKLAY